MERLKIPAQQSPAGFTQSDESEWQSGFGSQGDDTVTTATPTRSLLTKKHMIVWWLRERCNLANPVVFACIRFILGLKYGASSLMPPLTELFAAEYQRERILSQTGDLSFGILKRLQAQREISDRQGM
jgi:hypothetical protein